LNPPPLGVKPFHLSKRFGGATGAVAVTYFRVAGKRFLEGNPLVIPADLTADTALNYHDRRLSSLAPAVSALY
jgi:hypothetical protein